MATTGKTISFRAAATTIRKLDELADAEDRPRSYLINEAIANYIELRSYQDDLVKQGIDDIKRGRVVSHENVVRFLKKTGRLR
jgi:predicted transcriptional regulator